MLPIGIYIHIPFCVKKCFYCDFNSVPLKSGRRLAAYLKALRADITHSARGLAGRKAGSIYFGGGTPSLLRGEDAGALLKLLKKAFAVLPQAEITLEANPATLTAAKLSMFKEAGINRISLGVQSFNDAMLNKLGRAHTSADAAEALRLIRKAGFRNISIDLMYGLPGQTLRGWQNELRRFLAEDIAHVSFYDLKIEKNTLFYRRRRGLCRPDEDTQAEMYLRGREILSKAGYEHYEISSFARPGMESRHNRIYWRNEEYLGIGAGAYSYINGERCAKQKAPEKYVREAALGNFCRYRREKLGPARRAQETLALRLRLLRGLSRDEAAAVCPARLSGKMFRLFDELAEQGLIKKTKQALMLSEKGILFYDTVACAVLNSR